MEQIGKEVQRTLVLRPATATIREDVYYTYACRKCSIEATETPIMSSWILRAADDWLTPIYEEMKKRLVKEKILHADETTLQVLKEPGKSAQSKSYMWLYRTGKYASQPMILYEYRPDRKASNAETSLKEFSGWLHADGYPGYHRLPEHIRVVGCWAHLRRKFDEAVKSLP